MHSELKRMQEMAIAEIKKINDKGFNPQTLEYAYKLVDIIKDIDEHKKMCGSDEIPSARTTGDCNTRLMNTLDDYMESFNKRMEEMLADASCDAEREKINSYLKRIKEY